MVDVACTDNVSGDGADGIPWSRDPALLSAKSETKCLLNRIRNFSRNLARNISRRRDPARGRNDAYVLDPYLRLPAVPSKNG